jgi:hypothetical protein
MMKNKNLEKNKTLLILVQRKRRVLISFNAIVFYSIHIVARVGWLEHSFGGNIVSSRSINLL